MRKSSSAWAIALFILVCAVAAYPCGDKLLLLMRSPRYQENARPASILAYAPSTSQTAELVAAGDFRQALGKAGHQLQVVESANALRSALDSGHYDLVLADSQDGKTVQDASPDAFLLPVVDAHSPTDVRSAEQNYKVIIRAPGKNGHHLDAIQKALQLKDKRGHAMAAR